MYAASPDGLFIGSITMPWRKICDDNNDGTETKENNSEWIKQDLCQYGVDQIVAHDIYSAAIRQDCYLTADKGKTWRQISISGIGDQFNLYKASTHGFAMDKNHKLYRCENLKKFFQSAMSDK